MNGTGLRWLAYGVLRVALVTACAWLVVLACRSTVGLVLTLASGLAVLPWLWGRRKK